ncbi:precorrin-6A reductase [Methanobacterium alcaliphilum]|uniref:precorrin-6A reductase n=1 Tax=Methanobacterium alcaliphilum TaxID=392018 RepID=UPI00200A8815|nr:precorrin-6A reductase [Methanobacterium alcaliphilum]MCK9150359.1 precorrin-6A reductase [Methanobacterium alcaliphilum]
MRVVVMAGTQDGVQIIELLNKIRNIHVLATTVTKYGAQIAKKAGANKIISKPLNKDGLVDLILSESIDLIIDATHPFAIEATKNAVSACQKSSIKYIRFERPSTPIPENSKIHQVNSFKEAGKLAFDIVKNGKIMHLAGVSTLNDVLENYPLETIFVRVLPIVSSIKKCEDLGIKSSQIIAMQGIFSKEFNQTLMREYGVSAIITKESGETGGVSSKIDAALELDIDVIIVNRPNVRELSSQSIVNDLKDLKDILLNLIN